MAQSKELNLGLLELGLLVKGLDLRLAQFEKIKRKSVNTRDALRRGKALQKQLQDRLTAAARQMSIDHDGIDPEAPVEPLPECDIPPLNFDDLPIPKWD